MPPVFPFAGFTMKRWWWIGDHGSLRLRDDAERAASVAQAAAAAAATAPSQNVALVVGSTGLVGAALLDMLPSASLRAWKVYALSRSPLPPWSAAAGAGAAPDAIHVVHLHVDLADPAAVAAALEPLTDITHVFYCAWSPCRGATEEEARETNCDMLRNVLDIVVPFTNCPDLVHLCVLTGRKQFLDPFEPLTGISSAIVEMLPYSESLPRHEYPDLEDVLLDALAPIITSDGGVCITSWSVHRPAATLLGFSPRSARNVVASLCVYAAICRKEGGALRWPGSQVAWEGFSDASDAELVAEQMLWAALDPCGNKETFNCTNGDVYKWKSLWPMLASHFEVEEWSGYDGEDKRFKLEEAMAGKEAVWAEIVSEKGLVETHLDDITSWWFVDALINADKEHLENMNKCKERGFLDFRNTVRSFNTLIEKMKADRIVP